MRLCSALILWQVGQLHHIPSSDRRLFSVWLTPDKTISRWCGVGMRREKPPPSLSLVAGLLSQLLPRIPKSSRNMVPLDVLFSSRMNTLVSSVPCSIIVHLILLEGQDWRPPEDSWVSIPPTDSLIAHAKTVWSRRSQTDLTTQVWEQLRCIRNVAMGPQFLRVPPDHPGQGCWQGKSSQAFLVLIVFFFSYTPGSAAPPLFSHHSRYSNRNNLSSFQ